MTAPFDPAVRRVAVIGDVGGHLDELTAELQRLGADEQSGELPPDLAVVQVGDLVHRGPDSERVIALVDRYLQTQPGQWVQLVGNHEAQYLGDPLFAWPERIGPEAAATVRRWWATGQMLPAVGFRAGMEDFLVTHAGLTEGFWRDLGGTRMAREAADQLNGMVGGDEATLFRAGVMLKTRRRSRTTAEPGPLWAEAARELVASWRDRTLPFSQVHGHTSVVSWGHGTLAPGMLSTDDVRVDFDARHATVKLDGGRIIGVDPGHGRRPHPWRSLELQVSPGGS